MRGVLPVFVVFKCVFNVYDLLLICFCFTKMLVKFKLDNRCFSKLKTKIRRCILFVELLLHILSHVCMDCM